MTSHFPLSSIMNTSRDSTSRGLLPPCWKGRERPIPQSARRASRCSRVAGVTAGGEVARKERSFTPDSPRGLGTIIANGIHCPVGSASALMAWGKWLGIDCQAQGWRKQPADQCPCYWLCQRSTARDLGRSTRVKVPTHLVFFRIKFTAVGAPASKRSQKSQKRSPSMGPIMSDEPKGKTESEDV